VPTQAESFLAKASLIGVGNVGVDPINCFENVFKIGD
jgi:hypothetical protein